MNVRHRKLMIVSGILLCSLHPGVHAAESNHLEPIAPYDPGNFTAAITRRSSPP